MDINQVTLECLMNPYHYEKYLNKYNIEPSSESKEEYIKYKKEILELILKMFNGNNISDIVNSSFENLCNQCIMYINTNNQVKILQEDYKHLKPIKEEPEEETNYNDYLHHEKEIKNTLDNFVIKKNKKKKKKVRYPKKRYLI